MDSSNCIAENLEWLHSLCARLRNNESILTKLELVEENIGVHGACMLAQALKFNNQLTILDLSNNNMGDKGACALADALKLNDAVRVVSLINNNIGAEGAHALSDMLKVNTTVSEMYLGKNKEVHLYENSIGAEGSTLIANALKLNSSLKVLHLDRNDIGTKGGSACAEALALNPMTCMSELSLQNNNIGDVGASALAQTLRLNTLTKLYLNDNNIGADRSQVFANALTTNTSLTVLFLDRNNCGDEGAHALADALTLNTTLTELYFGENDIGVEGILAVAESLKVNISIAVLSLMNNNVRNKGARAIADALNVNSVITELDLAGCKICDDGARSLARGLKANRVLIELNLRGNNICAETSQRLHIEDFLVRNKLFHDHREGFLKRGVSFYFDVESGDRDNGISLGIKETVWEASFGDGIILELVLDALKKGLDTYNRQVLKELLDQPCDLEGNYKGSPLVHLAAGCDSDEALELCRFLVEEIEVDFDKIVDYSGLTARDIAQGNARTSKWAKSVAYKTISHRNGHPPWYSQEGTPRPEYIPSNDIPMPPGQVEALHVENDAATLTEERKKRKPDIIEDDDHHPLPPTYISSVDSAKKTFTVEAGALPPPHQTASQISHTTNQSSATRDRVMPATSRIMQFTGRSNRNREMRSSPSSMGMSSPSNIPQVEATVVQGVEATLIRTEPILPIYNAVPLPFWRRYQKWAFLGLVLVIGALIATIIVMTLSIRSEGR